MITATEALGLPSASLDEDEMAAATKMLEKIDEAIRETMKYNGVACQTDEVRPQVNAYVTQRLLEAGWAPTWQAIVVQPRLQGQKPYLNGFHIILNPTSDAYKAAVSNTVISPLH